MIDTNHPVVVGFSNRMSPFEEMWPTTHRALLPIVGKQIIVHNLERLRNLGHRNFRIADHLQQPFVRHRLRQGEEWGVALRYSDLSGTALLLETVSTFGAALYIHGDQLLEPSLKSIESSEELVTQSAIDTAQPGIHALNGPLDSYRFRPLADKDIAAVVGAADFRELAIRSCQHDEATYTLPGSSLHRGARADWNAHIAPDALIGSSCFVGKHCRLERGVALVKSCVLGNGVYLDKGTQLKNCVVLPNTYIGRGMQFENSIISAQGIIDAQGNFTPTSDKTEICATRDNQEETTGLPRKILLKKSTQRAQRNTVQQARQQG